MKFYNREEELAQLKEIKERAFNDHSKLTVLTGRRRVGKTLELFFKQKILESFQYRTIGSWWEAKGTQNEVDIVAISLDNKKALVVEVKRQKKNFKPAAFQEKVELLRSKLLHNYEIETACWDMEEM
jgi:hypothetical protein